MKPIEDRFWSKVEKGPDCWEWTGSKVKGGYGQIGKGGREIGNEMTHRLSWEIHNGPIPEGMFVCHSCDNRSCVNPDHLFLGTHSDNVQDMVAKGRVGDVGRKGTKHHKAKLTDEDVREIRAAEDSTTTLALIYGVSTSTIQRVKSGKGWSHVR